MRASRVSHISGIPSGTLDRLERVRRVGLSTLGVLALFLLSSCGRQPTPDVDATAQALVHLWATQTVQAQPTPDVRASAEALALLWATQTAQARTSTPEPSQTPGVTAPVPSLSPSPVTATFTPTPTRTPSPTPTRTPTPTPTPTATCPIAVDSELAPAWDRARLGCPMQDVTVIWAAWEPFEHGYMLWLSDIDWIYVLEWQDGANPAGGTWLTQGEAWRWDGISFPNGHGLTPPPGLFEPIRGFGVVWFGALGGQTGQLGWATDQEKGFCAALQPFESGLIVHSINIAQCQDGTGAWQTPAPGFAPLLLGMAEDLTWKRY